MSDSVNQLINHEAVCRTAPATPGLSMTLCGSSGAFTFVMGSMMS